MSLGYCCCSFWAFRNLLRIAIPFRRCFLGEGIREPLTFGFVLVLLIACAFFLSSAGTGGYLRSAPMEYVSLLLTEPVAHDVLTRLGNLAIPAIQFTDLNGDLTAFKRHYTPFIRRCDELEKKLAFFEAEMAKAGVEPEEYTAQE